MMNKFSKLFVFCLAVLLFGCQQVEPTNPEETLDMPMKSDD